MKNINSFSIRSLLKSALNEILMMIYIMRISFCRLELFNKHGIRFNVDPVDQHMRN